MRLFELVKRDRYARLGKEFSWIALGQVMTVVGSLVGIKILTELLSPVEYGQLALGMTAATLIHWVVLGPLSNGATRFFAPARESKELRIYFGAVRQTAINITKIILACSIPIAIGLSLTDLSQWALIGLAGVALSIITGYNNILNGIQNAARQRAVVALHQALATWGRFLIAAGLILWLGASSLIAMVGYALAMFLVLPSQYIFFRRITKSEQAGKPMDSKIRDRWKGRIYEYSWPFATWGILGWSKTAADRWGLEFFSSTEDVGLYAVLFQLGNYPISIVIGMVTTLLAPIYFQRVGDAMDMVRVDAVFILGWRIMSIALTLLLAAVLASYFLHEFIFSLLVAKEYSQISYLLPGMVLSAVLYEGSRFLTIVLQAEKTVNTLILPNNISYLIGMALILAGAYWKGLEGVVVASVLHGIIRIFWIMTVFRSQHTKIRKRKEMKPS